jgi:UDP-glucose 4-epimerase
LPVCGADYATPDGTAIRDYVHVSDLAAAHVRAIDYLSRREAESVGINLGTGLGLSVQDIIQAVERHAGRPAKIVRSPRRPGDPEQLVADNSLARRALDWQPGCSDIDTIISSALNWHLQKREYTAMPNDHSF